MIWQCNMQELTAEAAAARQAAATAEAETARVRGKSEDIQRKARSAFLTIPMAYHQLYQL